VLPVELADIPDELLDLTEAVKGMHVSALLHRRTDGTHHNITVDGTLGLVRDAATGLSTIAGTVTMKADPRTADFGGPLGSGRWYPRVATGGLGMSTSDPVSISGSMLPAPALLSGLPAVPYRTRSGNLAVAVDSREVPLIGTVLPAPSNVHVSSEPTGSRLRVDVPRLYVDGDGERPATLRLGGLPLQATLVAEGGQARVDSWFSALPGRARLELDLDGTRTALKLVLHVAPDGTVRAEPPEVKLPGVRRPQPRWRRRVARVPGARRIAGVVRRALR
jgi:hypothetical protein